MAAELGLLAVLCCMILGVAMVGAALIVWLLGIKVKIE